MKTTSVNEFIGDMVNDLMPEDDSKEIELFAIHIAITFMTELTKDGDVLIRKDDADAHELFGIVGELNAVREWRAKKQARVLAKQQRSQ